jgi:hypothetical protein
MHVQGVAKKKIEIKGSPPAVERPNLPAVGFFILIALAITAALYDLVPDAWWGVALR